MSDDSFSIYIHWPFCTIKCPYCDFNSYKRVNIDEEHWWQGYKNSIDSWARVYNKKRFIKSIFFGGGTPSLLKPDMIGRILERISKSWTVDSGCEISIEANPNSINKEKLKGLKSFGVNRVSIGVQALNNNDLKVLGRDHNLKQALTAVYAVKDIYSNFNIDFIYGRQFQKVKDWEKELKKILEINAPHLSLYQLTIEEKTFFYKLSELGRLNGLPDEDMASDFYLSTKQLCDEFGYINYEISNYAKMNYFCKHNMSYWRYKDYLGIGAGAHGRITLEGKKYASVEVSNPDKWLEHYLNKKNILPSLIALSEKRQFEEKLIMNLRIAKNIPIADFDPNKISKKLYDLTKFDLISIEDEKIILKEKGKLLLNYLTNELLECY